jgi:hypothetical protein
MCVFSTFSPHSGGLGQKWWLGSPPPVSVMSPDDRLLLILRRLDEIERKLDCLLEELKAPTALDIQHPRIDDGNAPGCVLSSLLSGQSD